MPSRFKVARINPSSIKQKGTYTITFTNIFSHPNLCIRGSKINARHKPRKETWNMNMLMIPNIAPVKTSKN